MNQSLSRLRDTTCWIVHVRNQLEATFVFPFFSLFSFWEPALGIDPFINKDSRRVHRSAALSLPSTALRVFVSPTLFNLQRENKKS